ncbi:MAG: hypothetical protein IKF07_04390 [Eubacterium sp.]|nr:hypothetical protein [Eubacterium sp.]
MTCLKTRNEKIDKLEKKANTLKVKGSRKISINKKTGKITIKKGLKKGTYKVKIKVKAAGNDKYKASKWKKVTCKIRVR